MSTLMCGAGTSEPDVRQVLQIISRFGLPLGVGDKTVEEVCRENGVEPGTFLSILNRTHNDDVDIPTLKIYLKNAHTYFLDFALPRIRQELIEAINLANTDHKIPLQIVKFFDEYVEEIRVHIHHENESVYPGHAEDDRHIAEKLGELKNIIVKYYPNSEHNNLIYTVLHDIYEIEQELKLHCSIEDGVLLPAMKKQVAQKQSSDPRSGNESLSDREKEVLKELVNGKSNKEIADCLCISTHTVISHRKNISRKLNIHSLSGLTVYAILNKIIEINEP